MVFNKQFAIYRDQLTFMFNGCPVEETDNYNYVGIVFSNKGDRFGENHVRKRDRALKAVYAARKVAYEAVGHHLSAKLQLKIFESQITPVLEYGCEIWYNGRDIPKLETVHTSYLKQTLGVKSQTSNLAVYGETGRSPLILRQQEMLIKYWLRLLTIDKEHLLSVVYRELCALDVAGHITWVKNVRELLSSSGMGELWLYQDGIQSKYSSSLYYQVKSTLHSNYKSFWESEINDSTKHPILRTYKLFKTDFNPELYLFQVRNVNYRRALTRFRVSSHKLAIETGRHHREKVPVHKRICAFCKDQLIDDEIHFLVQCEYNKEERNTLYHYAKTHIPDISSKSNIELFCKLMKSDSAELQSALGKFLHICFNKRAVTST